MQRRDRRAAGAPDRSEPRENPDARAAPRAVASASPPLILSGRSRALARGCATSRRGRSFMRSSAINAFGIVAPVVSPGAASAVASAVAIAVRGTPLVALCVACLVALTGLRRRAIAQPVTLRTSAGCRPRIRCRSRRRSGARRSSAPPPGACVAARCRSRSARRRAPSTRSATAWPTCRARCTAIPRAGTRSRRSPSCLAREDRPRALRWPSSGSSRGTWPRSTSNVGSR